MVQKGRWLLFVPTSQDGSPKSAYLAQILSSGQKQDSMEAAVLVAVLQSVASPKASTFQTGCDSLE